MTDQTFRGFVERLAAERPDDLLTIHEPVDPRYRIQALITELERRGRFPALRVLHVEGAGMPVVSNLFASRARLAFALGVAVADLSREVGRRTRDYLKPVTVTRAPFQEVSVTGNDVDLFGLPLVTHYPVDAAPYITAGLVIARHPETGMETAGFHRIMVKGRNRCGISLHSRRRMWEFQRRAEELGRPLEVAVVIGIPVPVYLGALTYHLPADVGKFSIMGGLFREPLEIVPCASVDVAVPAGAEIVLEGRILPGVREPEGPFGEWTGYSSSRSTQHVLELTRLSHRRDPIYLDIAGGLTADHVASIAIIREDEILRALRRTLPNVRQVHVPYSGASGFSCYVSLKKTVEGQAIQAMITVLSVEYYLKLIVVVDEDIDVFNEREVAWAVLTRSSAEKMTLVPGAMGAVLDPMSDPLTNTITKVGIDATLPLAGTPAERLRLPDDVTAWATDVLARRNETPTSVR